MKKILANKGKYEIIVDDDDYSDVMEASQRLNWIVVGGKEKIRVRCGPQNGPFLYLHRFLVCPKDDEFVRFKNGNGLDNRKENLMVISETQARQGVRKRQSGSSKYFGVSKSGRGWIASISAERQFYGLGYYAVEIEAARAYDIKALELHGEFALSNNISEDVIPKPTTSSLNKSDNKTSKYKGVYKHNKNDGWAAMIRVKSKRIFLGVFDEEIVAARAYDIAAKEMRGPDEITNDISEDIIPVRRNPWPKNKK